MAVSGDTALLACIDFITVVSFAVIFYSFRMSKFAGARRGAHADE